ncbi:MAG: hypothetical protein AAF533_14265 [Acidobacteriota bacterium]
MTVRTVLSLSSFLLALAAPAALAEYDTRVSGVHGGGGLTVVEVDPTNALRVVAGGDNSGVHLSGDGGRTWRPWNLGLVGDELHGIAAVVFSREVSGRVFIAVGRGAEGGVYWTESIGDPLHPWTELSVDPALVFSSARENNSSIHPAGVLDAAAAVPRSTGRLLALYEYDDDDWILAAASFDTGLWVARHLSGTTTWSSTQLGITGDLHLRSLAVDLTTGRLYVASVEEGVLSTRVTSFDPDGTANFEAAISVCGTLVPDSAEELLTVPGNLIIAAGPRGVVRYNGTCHQVVSGTTLPSAGPIWRSLTAFTESGGDGILVMGATSPAQDIDGVVDPDLGCLAPPSPFGWDSVYVAEVGSGSGSCGSGWTCTSAVRAATVDICSPAVGPLMGAETWWRGEDVATQDGAPRSVSSHLGRNRFRAAYLSTRVVDGDHHLLLAGSDGLFDRNHADDGKWTPLVDGLSVSAGKFVESVPATGEVWFGGKDWYSVVSGGTGGDTITRWNLPQGKPDVGQAMAATSAGDVVISGLQGASDTPVIHLWETGADAWWDLTPRDCAGVGVVDGGWDESNVNWQAVDLVHEPSGTTTVAAVVRQESGAAANRGLWTRVMPATPVSCDELWQLVPGSDTSPMTEATSREHRVTLSWAGGTAPLWVYNSRFGLYRVDDLSTSSTTKITVGSEDFETMSSGYMAVETLSAGHRVWISNEEGLFVIDPDALTIDHHVTDFAGVAPGPLTLRQSCEVLLTIPAAPGPPAVAPRLVLASIASGSLVITDVADDDYRARASSPQSVAILSDDGAAETIGLALDPGGFVLASRPSEAPVSCAP